MGASCFHLNHGPGLARRESQSPALLDLQPVRRVFAPKFLPWWFPFIGAFVPFRLVEAIFDREQVFRVFEVVGVSFAPFFGPCPATGHMRISQWHYVVYV